MANLLMHVRLFMTAPVFRLYAYAKAWRAQGHFEVVLSNCDFSGKRYFPKRYTFCSYDSISTTFSIGIFLVIIQTKVISLHVEISNLNFKKKEWI